MKRDAVVTIRPAALLGSGSGPGGRDRLRDGTRSRAARDGFTACLGLPGRSRKRGVNGYDAVVAVREARVSNAPMGTITSFTRWTLLESPEEEKS